MEPGKRVENQKDVNNRIINLTKIRGPILPIHASKETGQTLLLTGAFLSSLISDKILKVSNLKVGGSPLYYLPGQEPMLENFIRFLNPKEREAYLILKERKVLKDDELEPSIRVALRNIKDFAHSFSLNSQPNVIFWRFFSLTDEELEKEMNNLRMISDKPKEVEKIEEVKIETKPMEIIKKVEEEKTERAIIVEELKPELKLETPEIEVKVKEIEPIFAEKSKEKPIKKPRKLRTKPQPNRFLDEIKTLLASKNLEFVRIEKQEKKEITLIAKQLGKDIFILALDKKRIDESDLLKAFRKASLLKLPYLILGKGEMPKKLKEIMEASRGLDRIERM
jgi:hypothetical protein